jgi:hypothetical protein
LNLSWRATPAKKVRVFCAKAALLRAMNSTDGIGKGPQDAAGAFSSALRPGDKAKLSKPAADYVEIENRLAAQREKPTAQFTSIFGQLRDQLDKR